ncbi:hypothetical protein ACU4GA_09045 [Methylobacterium oryzae CBMB20]
MKSDTQQDQLEIVSALAASLADRMLMERLTQGSCRSPMPAASGPPRCSWRSTRGPSRAS